MKRTLLSCAAVTFGLLGCFIMFAGWSDHKVKAPVLLVENDLQWGLGPDAFPMGVRATIIDGEPDRPELYTMRLRLPGNYKIAPHWLRAEQHITVLSGAMSLGIGARFEAGLLKNYPAGSYIVIPARMRYFINTRKGAVLQVRGQGPWEVNYVEASEDPRNAVAAYGR